MNEYLEKQKKIKTQVRDTLDSMGKTSDNFDDIKNFLEKCSQELTENSKEIHAKVISVYDKSSDEMKIIANKTIESTKELIPKIPEQYHSRLQDRIKSITTSFLENKAKMIEFFYTQEIDAQGQKQKVISEFDQRTDEWKNNRFKLLVDRAKSQLNVSNPIDFGTIWTDFNNDQTKFDQCSNKTLRDLQLLYPPENFSSEGLDQWNKSVHELLTSHENFVKTFIQKIQDCIDKRNAENNALIDDIEKELIDLKSEPEADAAINELIPMAKQTTRYWQVFIEKLTKYWSMQGESFEKSFASIRAFLEPLIALYEKMINDVNADKDKLQASRDKLKAESDSSLQKLEEELQTQSDRILLLVQEKDIKQSVDNCKAILSKIEAEYRNYYTKSIALFDGKTEERTTAFESIETNLLTQLKMEKTISDTDWSAPAKSTRSSTRSKTKKVVRRPQKQNKKFKDKDKEHEKFSFELETGAIFSETSPLNIIPQFEEFVDGQTNTTVNPKKSGRSVGRPPTPSKGPRKSPARNVKTPQKGKKVEVDNLDIPDFLLFDKVPLIKDKPAITVSIPTNGELLEWENDFRQKLISTCQKYFISEINISKYESDREALAAELNDRMRCHAPRMNSIELNIAQARTLQVESRQIQMERYLMKATQFFNSELKKLEQSNNQRKESILSECHQLRRFFNDLKNQKSVQALIDISGELKIEDKKFLADFERQCQEQEAENEQFVATFKTNNDRFFQTIKEGGMSEEETIMCSALFDRLNSQLEPIISQLKTKVEGMKTEINNQHKTVIDEFENALPFYKIDLELIEKMQKIHQDFKVQYDALIHDNKHKLNAITESLSSLAEIKEIPDESAEKRINHQFESIDTLRKQIIQEAHSIDVMTSKMTAETLKLNIDLMNDLSENDGTGNESGPGNAADKKRGRQSRQSKTRPETKARTSSQKKEAPHSPGDTLQGKVDALVSSSVSSASQMISEYYQQFKQRKVPITRPDHIPTNSQECTEKLRKNLTAMTLDLPKVLTDSAHKLRSQIQESMVLSREIVDIMYSDFIEFYSDLIQKKSDEVRSKFQSDLEILDKEKEENRKLLNPKLADPNNAESLKSLIEKEQIRASKEKELIDQYETSMLKAENDSMKLFVSHLPQLTQLALLTFDNFAFSEDVVKGKIETDHRFTTKEILKEHLRREQNPQNDDGRPFRRRTWLQLPTIMGPLAHRNAVEEIIPATPTNNKRKRRKSEKTPHTPTKQGAPEMTLLLSSLETPVHRGVILNMKRTYEEYESSLKQRIDSLTQELINIKTERANFLLYWKQCVETIQPAPTPEKVQIEEPPPQTPQPEKRKR